jgi:RHS repeat-associated protein
MQIDFCGAQTGMAKQALNGGDRQARLGQMPSESVAELVAGDPQPSFPAISGQAVLDAIQDTKGAESYAAPPCEDAFVTKLEASGSALAYSTYPSTSLRTSLGGGGDDQGNGIALDGEGGVYVAGEGNSVDFPVTPGAYDTALNGTKDDAFIVKISEAVPPPSSWTTTYTFTYDPLYRLAGAAYSTGEFFEYTYDAVGNRLSETTHLGTTTYHYDDANRLTSVDGVTYTWDENGNLLSDGVNTYTYDHANRLTSVVGPSSSSSYAYNGLGDRLQGTVDGVTTNYSLDLNNWLTQVLADGTTTYLYGTGRIAQYDASGAQYFLADALGSVRQLVDSMGVVGMAEVYEPFGEAMTSAGTTVTSYGFTGEWTDLTGLVYLRARYYAPVVGRFISKDPMQRKANSYLYAGTDPINRIDPTGYFSIPATGLASFVLCFDLHSLSHGTYTAGGISVAITAGGAVDICRIAYSRDMWSEDFFNLKGDYPATGHDLFGWYLFERGGNTNTRLEFDANQPLTKELAKSTFVQRKRLEYYFFGDTPVGEYDEYRFNKVEQAQCMIDYLLDDRLKMSLPLTCVLGTACYQVKTVDNGGSVGFRVDNRTDLESGTHIAGRFPGTEYGGSVEELIEQGIIRGDERLVDVINQPFNNGEKVVSILRERTRRETGEWTDFLGFSHQLGGGNLSQTFIWKENRDLCKSYWWWLGLIAGSGSVPPGMQVWQDYGDFTVQPRETAP